MPEYRISVVVDPTEGESGGKRSESALQRISVAANRTRDTVDRLGRDLGKLGQAGAGGLDAFNAKARIVEVSLTRLDSLAKKTAQDMQEVFAVNQAAAPQRGFAGLKSILDKKGLGEIEGMISGFNRSAVAGANARAAVANFGQTAGRASQSTGLLKTELGRLTTGFVAVAAARQAVSAAYDLSNTYGDLQNRLTQVTDSSGDLAAVNQRLLDVANEAGARFEDVGGTYGRVRGSLEKLGFTSNETIQFTENLTKALASSGKTGAETSAAMTQLSQALASGKLQGDEFRTITEAFPELLDIIAKQMGTTTFKIKELSSEGKITADVLAEALIGAGDEIDEKFSKRIPTAAQAFQQVKNEILRLVGEGSRSLGPFIAQFARGLSDIAKGLVPFVKSLSDVAAGIQKMVGSEFVEFFVESAEAARNAADAVGTVAGEVADLLGISADGDEVFKRLFSPKTVTDITNQANAFHNLADAVYAAAEAKRLLLQFDLLAQKSRANDERIAEIERKIAEADLVAFRKYIDGVVEENKKLVEAHRHAEAAAKRHSDELDRLFDSLFPIVAAQREQEQVAKNLFDLVERGRISYEEANDALHRWTEQHQEALDPVAALNANLEEQHRVIFLTKEAIALENREREIRNDLLTKGVDLVTADLEAQRAARLEAELTKFGANRVELQDISKAPTDVQRGRIESAKEATGALAALKAEIADTDAMLENTLIEGFRGLQDIAIDSILGIADALGTMLRTGRADWKSFAESLASDFADLTRQVLADLLRMQIQIALTKALSGGGGVPLGFGTDNTPFNYFGNNAIGGSYMVRGRPGVEEPVFLRAKPGERVDVLTTEQQAALRRGDGRGSGAGAPDVNVNLVAQIGDDQIMDVLGRNRRQLVQIIDSTRGRR